MATIDIINNTVVVVWEDETATGDPVRVPEFPDRTVMAHGSGTIAVEGSMDGTNWAQLRDHDGVAISALAVNDPRIILENTRYMRVVVTGGTATVTIVGNKG